MGGNAFEDVEKLTPEQYEKIKGQLLDLVSPLCIKIEAYIPLPEKTVHGDIDFLMILKPDFKLQDIISLMKLSKGEYIINNNMTANTVYRKKQIDFNIVKDSQELARTRLYKSYSGIGAFLGLLLQSKLVKFNEEGIFCCCYKEHHKIECLVCKEPEEILKFYGLSPHRYAQGFKTRKQLYLYLLKARFLNVESFRSKKPKWTTKLIDGFQQFLKEHEEISNPRYQEYEDPIAMTLKYFNKEQKYEKTWISKLAEEHKKKQIAAKWNGKHIMNVFGVPSKAINELKKQFQAFFQNKEEQQKFIESHSFAQIVDTFSKACNMQPIGATKIDS